MPRPLLIATLALLLAAPLLAEESSKPTAAKVIPEPTRFITEHTGRFGTRSVSYQAIAGETYLRDMDGKPRATIFAFSYLERDAPPEKPVTFLWNGGPGSASVWLHMGAYGPKRIVVPSDAGHPGPPPYRVAHAGETLLDITDLVFVDPVGTGYSRALGDTKPKAFWGLPEDPKSIAEFIRAWLTEHKRWNSPRFLLGESYGTTRAAAVAHILEEDMEIAVNGIAFISQALDYAGSSPYVDDNLTSFITYLPTLAATALYHDRVSPKEPDQSTFLAAAREFAVDDYLPALWKGNRLGAAEYENVRDRLTYFTGISSTYLDRVNLRLRGDRFAKELLRDQGLAVGHLDSRYLMDDIDDVAAQTEGDAASTAISPAYKAAFMQYVLEDLQVDWHRQYLSPADPQLSKQWDWNPTENPGWEPRYVNTAHALSAAMRHNPKMELFVACGYFDLVTPFFDAEYTLGRHGIDASRVHYEYYQGGHMMYVHEPARSKLLDDTRRFIQRLAP
ncbi:MAG: serine carboxypeptidase [Pseudomonadota bacterium]